MESGEAEDPKKKFMGLVDSLWLIMLLVLIVIVGIPFYGHHTGVFYLVLFEAILLPTVLYLTRNYTEVSDSFITKRYNQYINIHFPVIVLVLIAFIFFRGLLSFFSWLSLFILLIFIPYFLVNCYLALEYRRVFLGVIISPTVVWCALALKRGTIVTGIIALMIGILYLNILIFLIVILYYSSFNLLIQV